MTWITVVGTGLVPGKGLTKTIIDSSLVRPLHFSLKMILTIMIQGTHFLLRINLLNYGLFWINLYRYFNSYHSLKFEDWSSLFPILHIGMAQAVEVCTLGKQIHFIQHCIDGLIQERHNSIAYALELHLPCTNPSIYYSHWWPGPVFCLLLRVSSDYAQPITGQVTEVTCPVIGRAQPELTPSKR